MRIRTPIDLGLVIRARRKQHGLDQRALAARVGVSRQWIVAIEQGKTSAEIGLVLRTLQALGVTLEAMEPEAPNKPRRETSRAVDIDAVVDRARAKR
jgi:HTH-type transcriptional regulator/antitoxin HipB